MMRCRKLEHRFVQTIPEVLEPGVLYISVEYCTVSHSCCCGCGEEVVTPLSPVGWEMTFDGESVSLWPSIGSWTLPCRSHYVIDRGTVLDAPPWSDAQVAAARRREKSARGRHYGTPAPAEPAKPPPPEPPATSEEPGWWSRLRRQLFGPKRERPE